MNTFRQPEYLTDDDQPVHRIRCPIHGFSRFSDNERRIMDHLIWFASQSWDPAAKRG